MPTETTIVLPSVSDANSQADAVIFPDRNAKRQVWYDIKESVMQWRIWLMLAYQDIKLRYRRSVLGPFWITISMAITVYSMGFLYGHLFHIHLQDYFPFLVSGMITWTLISTQITELTDTFVSSESLIKQIKLPYVLYVHRISMRNMLIFFHNIIVIVPVLLIFHEVAKVNFYTLALVPGLLLIYINSISYGLLLAMIGARYRDISQVIKSMIQVIFFLTPIVWSPEVLPPDKKFIALWNPFSTFVEIVRAPLIGKLPTMHDYIVAIALTVVGIFISYTMFVRYRNRIVYWL